MILTLGTLNFDHSTVKLLRQPLCFSWNFPLIPWRVWKATPQTYLREAFLGALQDQVLGFKPRAEKNSWVWCGWYNIREATKYIQILSHLFISQKPTNPWGFFRCCQIPDTSHIEISDMCWAVWTAFTKSSKGWKKCWKTWTEENGG